MKTVTNNLAETHQLAADFVAQIRRGKQALIIGLYGNLGAGKTTFVQGVAKTLGIIETVASPTFVIEKKYVIPDSRSEMVDNRFKKLIHIDAYRLGSGGELKKLDWDEIIADPNNLILLEWPERVVDILPADILKLYFKFIDESKRAIEITNI